MDKCSVPGCRNYHGQYIKTMCRWHQEKFQVDTIMTEEMKKHIRIASPVHDRRTNKLKF